MLVSHLQLHPPQSDTSPVTHSITRSSPVLTIYLCPTDICLPGSSPTLLKWKNPMAEANVLNHKYLSTGLALHVQTHKSWLQGCAASLPSTPLLFTDRASFYKHPKYTPCTSTGVASQTLCASRATNTSTHPIWIFMLSKSTSGLLAGQVTLWLPNQETNPLVHH